MSISKFLLVLPCTDKAPHNNRLNNSLSLSPPRMACARALVLINYQRAGIAATSAYYLEANTGPEAPLRPAFPSTRSGFINRADHDHDDIKLFCLSSENALSTGVLDTSFICCSASSYFCPLRPPLHSSSQLPPLLQHARFSLSSFLATDSRSRFSALTKCRDG